MRFCKLTDEHDDVTRKVIPGGKHVFFFKGEILCVCSFISPGPSAVNLFAPRLEFLVHNMFTAR